MIRILQLTAALAALIYVCGFAVWYSGTPLGIAPVLDGKENLELATTWANDGLPNEPFYRAPLYPGLLAIMVAAGIPAEDLPLIARLLNCIAHLGSALMVGLLSMRIWGSRHAAWTGALLYAVYPVALHFAVDPLDITLGTLLFLGALLCAYPYSRAQAPTPVAALAAGTLIAMAAITRPHFLVLLPIIPLIAAVPTKRWQPAAWGILGTFLPLAVFAAANHHLSGQWVLLPTQGSYNLWAANKPGTHGKYLEQSVSIHHNGAHRNPTRIESEVLFEQLHGRRHESEAELNAYWNNRLFQSLANDPALHLSQGLRKAYFLINNTEQYNNKTYAFHKARSPWLRLNPLGWSLLLLGAGLALVFGRAQGLRWPLILTALIYAAGVAVFFVSARFRLPITPLLATATAGLATIPVGEWYRHRRISATPRQWLAAAAVLVAVGCSLTRFGNVADRRTFVQDHILIAQAAAEIGNDAVCYRESQLALDLAPTNPAAIELHLLSWFNLVVTGQIPLPDSHQTAAALQLASHLNFHPPAVRAVTACCMYRLGQTVPAIAIWQKLSSLPDSNNFLPLLALSLTTNSTHLLPPSIINTPESHTLFLFLHPSQSP